MENLWKSGNYGTNFLMKKVFFKPSLNLNSKKHFRKNTFLKKDFLFYTNFV